MLIELIDIKKSYGSYTIISNISLKVEDRERVGLIGVNGAGKSTILKIIASEIPWDEGTVNIARGKRIGYLKQNTELDDDNTIWSEMLSVFSELVIMEKELRNLEDMMGRDNVLNNESAYKNIMEQYAVKSELFEKNGGYIIEAKIKTILNGMGFKDFSYDTKISTLSGGEKTRLSLAKLLLQEPDLLLLDEPTNHLDIATLTWLEDYLLAYPGAILVVSHDRYFLDAIVTAIYEVERGGIKRYTGNYSAFVETKYSDRYIQNKKYVLQQRQIAIMEDYIKRHIVRATSSRSAKNKRKALEHLERVDKPSNDLKKARFVFKMTQSSYKDVLNVNNVSISVGEGDAKKLLLKDICFDIKNGDRAALIGANGIGKSTLFKALMGVHHADGGEICWGRYVNVSFYDQEQACLNLEKTVLDEIWDRFPDAEETRVRTVLGKVLLTGDDVFKNVSSLSGGERARLALAIIIMEQPNVMLLDELTNHLDLPSKEILEKALSEFEGTIIFISHDRYFINRIATRVLELTPSGINNYYGNYDFYIENKQPEPSCVTLQKHRTKKQSKAKSSGTKQEIGSIELRIYELESEISILEEELDDPELYKDYELFQNKYKVIEEKKTELKQCYEAWDNCMA